jgi:membrane-associated phospholipid phosphatase
VANLIVPGLAIFLASLIFVPGRTAESHAPRGLVWRRKLWEWNAGWMGLGVAYAGAYMATEGLKVAFGKPRPDMLDRCNPDLSAIDAHTVGALGNVMGDYSTLVEWTICQNRELMFTREGFVGFPSGHASSTF